ncbi:ubiquitin-associated domain-containing protein 2 [Elysia marginata]|uniref:Ubiquitin-associated domain-containing protein 2 n=1 Tax=Elysia marginata TaxID=1093978 RepID=A0AAV4GRI7_9GAST|nr:ubiquitin-associated domain-containing protein 2 [Elysia marginata]
MLALAGPAGFYGTPVTKVLLCHAVITYVLFTFPLQHFQHLFHYNQDVLNKQQLKRMFLSKVVFLDLPDLLFTCLLIYNFRIFERRFGSRKFASHMIATAVVASVLELAVFAILNRYNIRLGDMPTGLFSFVFPLYVPFYFTVPRVALTRIMGVPVTGKTLNYILGLQMISSEVETTLVVVCAVLSGVLWRANILGLQKLLSVPPMVGKVFDHCLGRYLEAASAPRSPQLPMGATLELQQRERLDRIEQQMMMTAIQANRRLNIGRPQPMNIANGPGMFGNVNPNQNDGPNGSAVPVSEEQVQRFVEMGFSDSRARQALRTSNNNPTLATNLLLQDMS